MAHDGHPANAFVEQIVEGFEISHGLNHVGQEPDFQSLLSRQAPDVEVVRRPVFDDLIAAKSGNVLARSDNRL